MKLSIASDHGGFNLKSYVIKYLEAKGYDIVDRGCPDANSVDYPVYGKFVCEDVRGGGANYGILICKTGIGMSVYANKYVGIRAGLVMNLETAVSSRAHNDCNIICLAANFTDIHSACHYIEIFINTPFEGGRHKRRVDMIIEREKQT